jgi:putative transposase
MARPLRLDYPDTFYHVLSRGNEKREIFRDEKDYLRFLEGMGQMAGRFHLEIHAYVLMSNHYHLLLHTQAANLSRAIQWLGVSYSVRFNRRHGRTGHLFQGRFKSFLVQDDRYLTSMCFYIHGNPLRAGIATKLSDYQWSSYPAYANRRSQPLWLTTGLVLGVHGGSRREFLETQRAFLEGKRNPLVDLRHGLYLGTEEFSEECRERAKKEEHPEKPQGRLLRRDGDLLGLTRTILKKLGEEHLDSALHPRRRLSRNRDLAIYILYQLGVYRNEEIGRIFGVGYTAITGAVKRGHAYIQSDPQVEKITTKTLNDI